MSINFDSSRVMQFGICLGPDSVECDMTPSLVMTTFTRCGFGHILRVFSFESKTRSNREPVRGPQSSDGANIISATLLRRFPAFHSFFPDMLYIGKNRIIGRPFGLIVDGRGGRQW